MLKGGINCASASPDSQFVFAFGGELSNEPVIWDIRESKNVRDRFYPRMNIEFKKADLKEDNANDSEDEEFKEKKKFKRSKIFKDDPKSKKNKKFKKNLKQKKSKKIEKKEKKFKNKNVS